jgi:alginate O-acetyltransferase complex protein AlgI
MFFNSLHFAAFFPLVALVYFTLPYAWRWGWLLAASYYFYMAWKPGYAALLLLTTITVYVFAFGTGPNARPWTRRLCLISSFLVNFGLLFFFKYFNFFSGVTGSLLGIASPPHLDCLMPLGISFYTFQAISYTIEVYRGTHPPEKHFGRFALYVAFFPTVLSGPIERSDSLLPQFSERHDFAYDRVTNGLKMMAWGLFQKVVIADCLAQLVNTVYIQPEKFPGPALIVASVFFTFQLYCDFSGYSDIAIGAAQVLGFRVRANFRQPYLAHSLAEFWRSWHISLSTWLRDYLYIPLGGNRTTLSRWCVNIVIVFFLCGLWHGANWTFMVWGLLHAGYLIVGRLSTSWRNRLLGSPDQTWRRVVQIAFTFSLVSFAWIFFRAESLHQARYIIGHMFSGWGYFAKADFWCNPNAVLHINLLDWTLSWTFIVLIMLINMLQRRGIGQAWINAQPGWVRWILYSALIWSIFLFGNLKQTEFYYLQF